MNRFCLTLSCAFLLVAISGCAIATPFRAVDTNSANPDREVLVAITHVVLGSDAELNEEFWDYSFRIHDELPKVPGLIGHSIRRRLFADEAWTMSVWENEIAMNQFVHSGLHREAFVKAGAAIKKVEYARTSRPRSQIPISWDEAEQLLSGKSEGVSSNAQLHADSAKKIVRIAARPHDAHRSDQ